jgi:ditrans,polycis-polyprenyl diphosphate synthase
MEWCYELGMRAVTVYAFSMENFNRTPEEVAVLMGLAVEKFNYMAQEGELVRQYGVRIRVLGELDRLPDPVRLAALNAMEMTKHNTEYTGWLVDPA